MTTKSTGKEVSRRKIIAEPRWCPLPARRFSYTFNRLSADKDVATQQVLGFRTRSRAVSTCGFISSTTAGMKRRKTQGQRRRRVEQNSTNDDGDSMSSSYSSWLDLGNNNSFEMVDVWNQNVKVEPTEALEIIEWDNPSNGWKSNQPQQRQQQQQQQEQSARKMFQIKIISIESVLSGRRIEHSQMTSRDSDTSTNNGDCVA